MTEKSARLLLILVLVLTLEAFGITGRTALAQSHDESAPAYPESQLNEHWKCKRGRSTVGVRAF